MKNLIVLCTLIFCFQAFAQRKPKIKGNKNVVEVVENLPPFNGIKLNDDLEIVLQKSSQEGYQITADDNLIDVLKFDVQDNTLVISSYYKITSKKKLDITINYFELNNIAMNDGRIRMKDVIKSDELNVNTYGSSKLELTADAPFININMEGNSSGDFNLDGDSVNIVLKDRIDVQVYSGSDSNTIKMYKNASLKMEGTANTFMVNLLENANLKAERFEANNVTLNSNDSSTAIVNALDTFELSSSGSSKVYLYGKAKITILDFLDTSELHKEK
ncbi:GIN domain-containing protein [Kriegella aquimaris]|uniref:Putative auto-transporter adhesin, head GIN domain n=1 Tax=Kriegella aquimaris TaxID=192904 RepID=A0A1G9TII5_9FLAO|nr:DUF2807 domain-containing protein [Kriegella aquimaris]SDM46925.1 Putative auto-transporter adhesin, head GIN domain [Kriegella aquimaris]